MRKEGAKALLVLTAVAVIAGALLLNLPMRERQPDVEADTPAGSPTAAPARNQEPHDASGSLPQVATEDPPDQRRDAERAAPDTSIPALPGLSGFGLRGFGREAAKALAEETRDHAWATEMEARILEALQHLEGLQVASMEVECRATACGILLVHGDDAEQETAFLVRSLRDRLLERLGFSGTSGVTTFRESGNFSAIYLTHDEGREQYAAPVPTVPALPGIAGFEIPRGDRPWMLFPPLYLARESDDPSWSAPMEARIFDELSRSRAAQVTQILVECRSSACGIVLGLPVGAEAVDSDIAAQLADPLGFRNSAARRYEGPGGPFLAIYLYAGPSSMGLDP